MDEEHIEKTFQYMAEKSGKAHLEHYPLELHTENFDGLERFLL